MKECKWSLKLGKGREIFSTLEPLERASAADIFPLAFAKLIFGHLTIRTMREIICVVLATLFIVICDSSHN